MNQKTNASNFYFYNFQKFEFLKNSIFHKNIEYIQILLLPHFPTRFIYSTNDQLLTIDLLPKNACIYLLPNRTSHHQTLQRTHWSKEHPTVLFAHKNKPHWPRSESPRHKHISRCRYKLRDHKSPCPVRNQMPSPHICA